MIELLDIDKLDTVKEGQLDFYLFNNCINSLGDESSDNKEIFNILIDEIKICEHQLNQMIKSANVKQTVLLMDRIQCLYGQLSLLENCVSI